ncbi:MAG: rod shape-determining protein [Clostridia bacterium]
MKKDLATAVNKNLCIDLGTSNTVIYLKGKGVILNEPSVIATEKQSDTIVAIGNEAKAMMERNPDNITIITPIQKGVVADLDATTAMLKAYIKKAIGVNFSKNSITVSYPATSTQVERLAVQDVAKQCVTGQVSLMSQAVAILLGQEISATTPKATAVIDIGAAHTEVSVCIFGEVLSSFNDNVGGNEIDYNIIRYIKNKYKLQISKSFACDIKTNIGSAFYTEENKFMDVKGRDIKDNIPKSVTVNSEEIREVIANTLTEVPNLIIKAIEDLPPQISADLMENDIIIAGGVANLKGLKEYMENITGLKVKIATNPDTTIAKGLSKY